MPFRRKKDIQLVINPGVAEETYYIKRIFFLLFPLCTLNHRPYCGNGDHSGNVPNTQRVPAAKMAGRYVN